MDTPFKLTRYFTATSLLAIAAVAVTLLHFEKRQTSLFEQVQQTDIETLGTIQRHFLDRADQVARRDLVGITESSNTNITQILANVIWPASLSAFMAQAQGVDVTPCRAMPDLIDEQGKLRTSPEKKACFQKAGQLLMRLPGFALLDQQLKGAIRGTGVYKIKVYDLEGTTVYATEHSQIGEDKSHNPGWMAARHDGRTTSELTFRGEFSTAHGQVENRDLIFSYLPVRAPDSQAILAVIELYGDVTPFLEQIKANQAEFVQAAQINHERLTEQSERNQATVDASSQRQTAVVLTLLVGLFLVLLLVVQRAQGIIRRQAAESDATKQRLAQTEKMTSLGQMVAGVTHQLNTPLAFSKNNLELSIQALEDLGRAVETLAIEPEPALALADADGRPPARAIRASKRLRTALEEVKEATHMLDDVLMGMVQMNELVDNLRNFSRLDRAMTDKVDLNIALRSVCYIAKTVISTKIELTHQLCPLPPITCNVSQLNQVFLNLIMNAAQAIPDTGTITVRTRFESDQICVSVRDTGKGIAPDVLPRIFDAYFTTKASGEGTGLGLAIARNIVRDHGGDIQVRTQMDVGTEFRVWLPIRAEAIT